MKRRPAQLASTISRALQEVLARGINDPRVQGLITVTAVELTDDLKIATVRLSVMPEEKQALTMHGLRSALPVIRKKTMDRVHMKEFPRLVLKLDEGLKEQAKIFALLDKARAEREARELGDTQRPGEASASGEPTP